MLNVKQKKHNYSRTIVLRDKYSYRWLDFSCIYAVYYTAVAIQFIYLDSRWTEDTLEYSEQQNKTNKIQVYQMIQNRWYELCDTKVAFPKFPNTHKTTISMFRNVLLEKTKKCIL